jgi:Right handed beta helix region
MRPRSPWRAGILTVVALLVLVVAGPEEAHRGQAHGQGEPSPSPAPASTPEPERPLDPTLAGWPDSSSTGVPAGVALTPYTGPARITEPGTVIDGKLVTVPLVIAATADDVTIRDSVIRVSDHWLVLNDEGATGLRIVDTELDGTGNASGDAAVAGGSYTLTRVNVHGTVDGLKVGSDVTVEDSYIHDLVMTAGSHNDGIQSLGSEDVVIRNNTVIVGDGATSAVLLSTGSASSMRRITIEHNLLGGGAYTVYGGYESGKDDPSKVSDIVVRDNHISTVVHPQGGAFGPITSVDSPVVTSGNVWHDGPHAGAAAR